MDVYAILILLLFLGFSQLSGATNSKSWRLPKSSPLFHTLGPNCWNTALVHAGLVSSTRLVSKAEFLFWMDSKYCRKVPVGAKLQTGDIGSFFWGERGIYHSFIHLKGDLVYSKNSPYPKDQPKVQRFNEMFEPHHRTQARAFWETAQESSAQVGNLTLVYFRCQPLEVNLYENEAWARTMDRELRQIELVVSKWITRPKPKIDDNFAAALLKLADLWSSLQSQAFDSKNGRIRQVHEILRYRILGLLLSDLEIGLKEPRLAPLIRWAYDVQYREGHALR